jgi:hypothetical protein
MLAMAKTQTRQKWENQVLTGIRLPPHRHKHQRQSNQLLTQAAEQMCHGKKTSSWESQILGRAEQLGPRTPLRENQDSAAPKHKKKQILTGQQILSASDKTDLTEPM